MIESLDLIFIINFLAAINLMCDMISAPKGATLWLWRWFTECSPSAELNAHTAFGRSHISVRNCPVTSLSKALNHSLESYVTDDVIDRPDRFKYDVLYSVMGKMAEGHAKALSNKVIECKRIFLNTFWKKPLLKGFQCLFDTIWDFIEAWKQAHDLQRPLTLPAKLQSGLHSTCREQSTGKLEKWRLQ